ncbi:hypothetical protein BCU90_20575 [Vibrio lentus]|nr:hypothetical protein BCU90_20575 [Vibrio lentus]
MQIRACVITALTMIFVLLPFLPESLVIPLFFQSLPTYIYVLICATLIVLTVHMFFSIKWYVRLTMFITLCGFMLSSIYSFNTTFTANAKSNHNNLSIVVWNTFHWDQKKSRESLINIFRSMDADIVMLQEHIYWSEESKSHQPATDLSILKSCCGYSYILKKGELVVASRHPITEVNIDSAYLQKTRVEVNYQERKHIDLINVHIPVQYDLASSPWESTFWEHLFNALVMREEAFSLLSKSLSKNIFIGGDFNSTLLSPNVRALTDNLHTVNFWPSFPYGMSIPTLWSIDHIFFSKSNLVDCSLVTSEVLSMKIPSDHLPIACVVYL